MKVGVLASGEGTNLQALLDTVHGREVEVVAVACDQPSSRALQRAEAAGVATRVFLRSEHGERAARDAAMADWLAERGVELVVLAGYMAILDAGFASQSDEKGSGERLPEARVTAAQGRLQALAQELGVADRVRFLVDVPDKDLPGIYNCAEIYLGLSRQTEGNVEGFGISLVEAGACGIPVIGARSGGIPDAVREGETGVLVDGERLDEVYRAVSSLLEDTITARRFGAAGRRAVESFYNWNRVATDLARMGHEAAAPLRMEVRRQSPRAAR